MNKDTQEIKKELEEFGYGIIDYPETLQNTVSKLMENFAMFCGQNLEHKQNMNYKNSMGYENRDKTKNPDLVDHKESFYIKAGYEFSDTFTPSDIDNRFVSSCKELLKDIIPLINISTKAFSEISEVDLNQYFDSSALTLRAIHYYPDSSIEIAHHHVDRGGQTYHLYESTAGLEAYWNGEWNNINFAENQMIYFPCIQAQYVSKSNLKGLCHRVVSTSESSKNGRYSLVLFVDYNKLQHKYSMSKKGPIEKAFEPGQNYNMSFNVLSEYFEEKVQIYRKGVSALIVSKNQELLLVNLQSFETRFYAIPGGGIEEGETLQEAVYREVKEELGISKESLSLVGLCEEPIRLLFKTKKIARSGIEYDGMERFFFGFNFIGSDSKITLQLEEIRAYKWVGFKDLKDYLLFDDQLEDTTIKLLELFPDLNK